MMGGKGQLKSSLNKGGSSFNTNNAYTNNQGAKNQVTFGNNPKLDFNKSFESIAERSKKTGPFDRSK